MAKNSVRLMCNIISVMEYVTKQTHARTNYKVCYDDTCCMHKLTLHPTLQSSQPPSNFFFRCSWIYLDIDLCSMLVHKTVLITQVQVVLNLQP